MFSITSEIKKVFSGDAWYGNHVMQTLNNVKPENAFTPFVANAHSIAEIALHLTSWTQEVTSRLLENPAGEPLLGDWPEPEGNTAVHWEKIIFNFKVANEELIRVCENIKPSDWEMPLSPEISISLGTAITKIELVNGLAQHHAYHSGQIALLSKF
ncbi:DinB family protein [Pedobacter sandarakinus]|uniref:DinB family protein n=1 Tax=Pedobacter sandarakinus TaxID=353156 RepID=UPI0022466521|nr:DinB family protein [Pedobacter sandarakinus]MCX2576284.1 hypothetical protein [Pedobacter sandarakinus]